MATETSVELLVVGIRERTAVHELSMRSVAQRTLLEVGCSILAVKNQPQDGGLAASRP